MDVEDECEVEPAPAPTADVTEPSSLYGVEENGDGIKDESDNVSNTPKGMVVIPKEGTVSTPISTDLGTSTGERNITDNIDNTSNTETEVSAEQDNEKVLNELIQSFRNRFGHLEKCEFELDGIATRARNQGYSVEKHIQLLQKKYQQWEDGMEYARKFELSEYQRTVDATLPEDVYGHIIATHTLQRAAKDCNIPMKYGAWIKGWDEELQSPQIFFAPNKLPLELVKKQKHNIAEIPKWYWKGEHPPA